MASRISERLQMLDLHKIYFKKPSQPRGEKAVKDILESFDALITTKLEGEVTTRDVIDKSGYSNGCFYRYFKKIDDIFLHQFISKIKAGNHESISLIQNHSPHDNVQIFVENFINLGFDLWSQPLKPTIIRTMIRYFLRNSENPELLNSMHDVVIPYIMEAQKRDLTKTFKQMDEEKLRLSIRAVQAIMRSPFIENHPSAGSKSHQDYAMEIAMVIFSNNVSIQNQSYS